MKRILIFINIVLLLTVSCKKEQIATNPKDLLHAQRGNQPGIYDASGRYVILRGVNYNSLGDYWQGNPNFPTIKKYDANDFKDMARLGMNCVRLVLNWSAIEPQPGVYNYAYIDSIKMAIEDAAKYNIYIILDMHQDAWGKYIVTPRDVACQYPNKGWDGAPLWATITDNASTCMSSEDFRESPPAVSHAFHNLWFNTNGIATNFVNMWKELVKATCMYPNVAGYDLINEPALGHFPLNTEFERYSKVLSSLVKGIREAEASAGGYNHIIIFENTIIWNGEKIPFTPKIDFTDDQNLVFSGHNYFRDRPETILTLEEGFDIFLALAKFYKTGFYCGEWLYFEPEYLNRFAALEDKHFLSGTFWQWAAPPGDPHHVSYEGVPNFDLKTMVIETDLNANFTGNYNEPAVKVLRRHYPRAIQGTPLELSSNPDNGIMHLKAKTASEGTTVVWINDRFGYPKFNATNAILNSIETVNGGYIASFKVSDIYVIDVSY